MPLSFAQADALFRQDKLNELVADAEGRRFVKLRSLNRTGYLERLFQTAGIARPDVGARQLFDAAFNAGINTAAIEACAREIYREEREQRRGRETELVNQLYRVQQINWGSIAWLKSPGWRKAGVVIPSGATFREFCELVKLGGGRVYEEAV